MHMAHKATTEHALIADVPVRIEPLLAYMQKHRKEAMKTALQGSTKLVRAILTRLQALPSLR